MPVTPESPDDTDTAFLPKKPTALSVFPTLGSAATGTMAAFSLSSVADTYGLQGISPELDLAFYTLVGFSSAFVALGTWFVYRKNPVTYLQKMWESFWKDEPVKGEGPEKHSLKTLLLGGSAALAKGFIFGFGAAMVFIHLFATGVWPALVVAGLLGSIVAFCQSTRLFQEAKAFLKEDLPKLKNTSFAWPRLTQKNARRFLDGLLMTGHAFGQAAAFFIPAMALIPNVLAATLTSSVFGIALGITTGRLYGAPYWKQQEADSTTQSELQIQTKKLDRPHHALRNIIAISAVIAKGALAFLGTLAFLSACSVSAGAPLAIAFASFIASSTIWVQKNRLLKNTGEELLARQEAAKTATL